MAEAVHHRLESSLPELQDLLTKKIFSKEEIQEIIVKRRKFEYKVNRRISEKSDFISYILYEKSLEDLRKRRFEEMGNKCRHSISDHSISQNICKIYQRALSKFKGDLNLWLEYFDFAISINANNILKNAFATALAIHPLKAEIWIKASTWEWKSRGKISSSRSLLQKALRQLPESADIWLCFFELEVDYASKVLLRSSTLGINEQNIPLSIMKVELPLIVHKHALEKLIVSVDHQKQFFEKAEGFEHFFPDLVDNLLVNLYENEKYISNIEIVGFIIQKLKPSSSLAISEVISSFMKVYFETSLSSYTKDTLELAIYQFTRLMHLDDLPTEVKILVADKIDQLYQYAELNNIISPEMYAKWIDLNHELALDSTDLINAALKTFPTSSDIILAAINSSLQQEIVNLNELSTLILKLPSNTPISVQIFEKLCLIIERDFTAIELLKRLLDRFDLAWLPVNLVIQIVRCLCNHDKSNYAKQLLGKRSFNELLVPTVTFILNEFKITDCHEVVTAFENTVSKYPCDEDIWLNYIEFELKRGNVSESSALYARAIACVLNHDRFCKNYENLIANLD